MDRWTASLVSVAAALSTAVTSAWAGVPARSSLQGGYRLELDPSTQVIALDTVPEDPALLQPRLLVGRGMRFLSAAVLAQKAKQFDDGLYAAVELASERGLGDFVSKRELIAALGGRLPPGTEGDAAEVLYSAARLGGIATDLPPPLRDAVDRRLVVFLADSAHSKPLGFYTWSTDLRAVFQQDRMLQTPLVDAVSIRALAQASRADERMVRAYDAMLRLASRLTNPLTGTDLRAVTAASPVPPMLSILPPSRSHETDLMDGVLGGASVPDDFDLMDLLVSEVRSGRLSLSPDTASGWYDHQTWAYEPLLRPDATPESARLRYGVGYRGLLEELFRGLAALTRETHVKQLAVVEVSAHHGRREETIDIFPDLSLEPLPTHYLRRARAYAFVRSVLVDAFGVAALDSMARLTADGPVGTPLGAELEHMERLYRGAFARSCFEIGADPALVAGERLRGLDDDVAALARWRDSAATDVDLGRDARMMIPVAWDKAKQEYEVWAFLGWEYRQVAHRFVTPPAVTVFAERTGKRTRSHPRLNFVTERQSLPVPVVVDLHVKHLLDRDQFRRLCDQHQTREAIVEALEAGMRAR